MTYFDALCWAMRMLAGNPRTIFIGQGVGCAGTTMTDTLKDVPPGKLLEFPVAEDLQMGTAIGMALEGWLPVCIFPRWNFMLLAANQIVNHLDRLPIYSDGGYNPKVIIRVATPNLRGFDPGPQHDDDFAEAFGSMLRTVPIIKLQRAGDIALGYSLAEEAPTATILVEYTDLYNTVPSGVKELAHA